MQHPTINIRPAQKSDAPIIAQVVAIAIGDENALKNYCGENYISLFTKIAEDEHSQYSFLRNTTYSIIHSHLGRTPSIPDETESGEFYLDSLAVLPEHRGIGIGRKLVNALCDRAFSAGHKRVGLIVDYNNPNTEALYTSLGFSRVGTKTFLGHKMWHLQAIK